MKVLVTGADGLLGSHIVKTLHAQSHQVRAFLLPNRPYQALRELQYEAFFGDILDADTVRRAVEGCDAVIHTAANTSVWPRRSEIVRQVNIQGTAHVIEACLQAGTQRLVHISSGSAFSFGDKAQPGTEESVFSGDRYGLDYISSKHTAQQQVLHAVRERGLPAIILAPTYMFGAHDSQPGSGKMIIAVYQRKLPGATKGGRNFVAAADVAQAAVNALTMGRLGECYLAGNQNMSYREIMNLIASVVGQVPPAWDLPSPLIKAAGLFGSLLGAVARRAPVLSYPMARIACEQQYYACTKAVTELAMPQTDLRIAIREAYDWFRANNYC